MESKVSEGGLNVTLTIRLLMHGKVRWGEVGRKAGYQGSAPCFSLGYTMSTHKAGACTVQMTLLSGLLKTGWPNTCTLIPQYLSATDGCYPGRQESHLPT